MGILCCCFRADDGEEETGNSNNGNRLHRKRNEHPRLLNGEQVQALPNTNPQAMALNSNMAPVDTQSNSSSSAARTMQDDGHNNAEQHKTGGDKATQSYCFRKPVQCSLDTKMKRTLEKLQAQFGSVMKSSEEEDVCPICLEEYDDENPRIPLQCSHYFHLSCIFEWMERSQACPVCERMMLFA